MNCGNGSPKKFYQKRNVHSAMYDMRMVALHDLVENGYLELPENPDTSSLGMYLYLK